MKIKKENGRIFISETKEIDTLGTENVAELKSRLRNELSRIRDQVKGLKSRAEEIQENIRILEGK